MKTINLKGQEWSTENFNTRTFKNGEPISFAKSPEEFKELTSSKKPCFTYYNYDENNYLKYGCCYNWFALIDKRGIAPEGFRIPNNEDFSLLLDNYIGRDRLDDDKNENDEIRNKLNSLKTQFYTSLKSKESWNETNRYGQNILGTDTFGFSLLAVPGLYENRGYRFSDIGDTFALWSSSKDSKYRWKLVGQHFVELSGHPFKASKGFGPTDSAAFIRLIKDKSIEKIENNEVEIGNQIWMNTNLSVDRFNNGDLILEAKTKEEWDGAGTAGVPAWCYYENDENNGKIYGKLYNWFAINDSRGIAPNGFKIPSKEDFVLLISQLNGKRYSVQKLKSKRYWLNDLEGTDSSGFNAIPSGRRELSFDDQNKNVFFWTSTEEESRYAFGFWFAMPGSSFSSFNKASGFSVRGIKI